VTPSNLHLAWARLFVGALAAAGVRHVVVSPGSRSTPLALAAAGEPRVTCHAVVDERAAAFFALGQARVSGAPSALVCTSGTAGAHYLPAVIEASASHVPLVVVTADRPWDAYDCAAPQTIDQIKLFGDHARFFAELGLPDEAALDAVPRLAAQAVLRARHPTPGAVHLNARFRKPLEPVDVAGPEPWEARLAELERRGAPRVYAPRSAPDEAAIAHLVDAVSRAPRGVVVAGPAPLAAAGAAEAIFSFARKAGFAVLAEATSQLRFGATSEVVGAFDVLLRDPSFRRALAPELAIELFAPPTSSGYGALVAERPAMERVVVAPHGWNDPQSTAAAVILADPGEALALAAARLSGRDGSQGAAALRARLERGEAAARAIVRDELAAAALHEGTIAARLVDALPEGALLCVGNSLPVRDLDLFAEPRAKRLRVVHQRGASGIDGLVSGAAGAASAAASPVALLVGDVSFQHDLGGLASLRGARVPLVVVVVQNDGGRIFDELPIAARPELAAAREALFTTPPRVSFEAAASVFGLRYAEARDAASYASALAAALERGGATILEAVVPPHDGRARRARVRSALAHKLAARADDEGRPSW
jgi:2-succinyl-5-enolpyruvyl-6-hydroxy-3-cyclohexene-1-carboxylate synthase